MKKEEKKINSFLLASEGKHRIYLLGQTQDEKEEYKEQNVGRGTRNYSNSRKKGVLTAVDECMLPK